ncbi:MAG: ribonucleoside-diphosphate reductase subunit alpha [Rickettsiales bacterium]|nr:ribonucleoside-diphosphate reductase subunit alpha [Rickettsiales bacterium]
MPHKYKIIKRNGQPESYDVKKIRRVIEWATKDFDLNSIKLESNVEMTLQNGITTRKIQQAVILSALSLTTSEEPDWKYVAGRLKLFDIYKDIAILRNLHKQGYPLYNNNNSFKDYIADSVNKGIYTDVLIKKYTPKELDQIACLIKAEYDLLYDYAGINLLNRRYLAEHNDQIWELPQEMYITVAMMIAQDIDKSNRLKVIKDVYEKLASFKISLATPLLMNLRKLDGNLSSCFITAMDDSRKSIFYTIDQISAISQHGGGVGCNVSRVRCKGARIRDTKNASGGVIPWIRIINDTAVAVNQQGKRKGAVTVSLDVWHMDIEDFLELQTENGDQRMKAYDIFPQVVIPNMFMEQVEANAKWLLVDPQEVRKKYAVEISNLWGEEFTKFYNILTNDAKEGKLELYKFVSAKGLLKKIMLSQVETGMPYIAFKDTLNKYNPNKHDGLILATNLCTESHSNTKPAMVHDKYLDRTAVKQDAEGGLVHVCNLCSINFANLDIETELESVCKSAVEILDIAIDLTDVPIPEGKAHNARYRTIGVGVMGLADLLAKNNVLYSESANYIDKIFEKFALYNIKASIEIAKVKGPFEAYKGSDWDRGIILGHDYKWFKENAKHFEEWQEVFENLKKYGIRNSQLSAIAPNTSTSLLQGCTASVLPVYSKFFIDTHTKGSIPNCPPFIKEKFWYYQENKNLDQGIVVDVISRISKWIDTGVSMELIYNLNKGVTAKTIYNSIIKAWKQEVKTIYYTRSVQQDGYVTSKEECVSCAS